MGGGERTSGGGERGEDKQEEASLCWWRLVSGVLTLSDWAGYGLGAFRWCLLALRPSGAQDIESWYNNI